MTPNQTHKMAIPTALAIFTAAVIAVELLPNGASAQNQVIQSLRPAGRDQSESASGIVMSSSIAHLRIALAQGCKYTDIQNREHIAQSGSTIYCCRLLLLGVCSQDVAPGSQYFCDFNGQWISLGRPC